jgi:hypothetical protein
LGKDALSKFNEKNIKRKKSLYYNLNIFKGIHFEQVDLVHRLIDKYSSRFQFVTTSKGYIVF